MQLSRKRQELERTKRSPKAILWRRLALGFGIFFLLALLVTGIWYGTRLSTLNINQVEVIGGETISHEEIQTLVKTELVGTYYRLIPKTFSFTYPEAHIAKRLSDLPRIENVLVELSDWQTISVVFTEYVPVALWCDSKEDMECVFLDHKGYGFSMAPQLSGGAFVRYVIKDEAAVMGAAPFTSDYMRRTQDFATGMYDSLLLNTIVIEQISDREIDYHLAGGGLIRTSLDNLETDALENLATLLTSTEFSHLSAGNFQYIDLRFGNKLYVNEELAPAPEGAGATSNLQ